MSKANKPITIGDIARYAGVSPSTVSRVLTGSKRVAEDKRARVLAVIEQHQYRPNIVARGLVSGRSMLVGVLVQDITSPFFANIVRGIEEALDQSPYRLMVSTTQWRAEQQKEGRSLELLLERRADGLIVVGGHIPDAELRAVAEQVPLVAVARSISGLEHLCLQVDNEGAAYRATRYLIGLGHRRIAHVTGTPDHPDAQARAAGYRRALAEAGLPIEEALIVSGQFTEDSGFAAVEELLIRGERFSAIFAANDQSAYGAMLALFNHGYRIPEDVSVVGFDNLFLSAYTLPPLTTVHHPAVEMGQAAAEGLLRMLRDEAPNLPSFSAELVIRQSAMRARQT
ncbi:LacI family DNA-binding transcriptional regulator [Kallotenue papyrolyticum]|uniref:LacI family DNA-binding transcriptional regulator n=1 Tax=Kallotenue papyrolyticum TaxID=1325125 RepID=UPI0004929718|nr:LacI family DNA-binding transcriptional regulator [Kallotenue papyrolyticum]